MKKVKAQVIKAMKHLGVKGTVKVIHIGLNHYRILLNGKYFGIFDTDRNTFVD